MSIRYLLKDGYLRLRGWFLRLFFVPGRIKCIKPEQVTSIAVIRIDRIGDVVASLPAVRALKSIFPQAKLAMVVPLSLVPLLENIPGIDRLIPYRGFWGTVNVLRKEGFYLITDLLMDYTLKTALLVFLSRPAVSAGFDISGRGRLFNVALKPVPGQKRMCECLMDIPRELAVLSGGDSGLAADALPRIFLSDEDNSFADDFLKTRAVEKGELIVGVAPGGKFPSQRWGIRNFAALADKISDKHKARIILIANSQERKSAGKLASLLTPHPLMAVGLPLNRLAAIISRMGLMVCNNSGPLHIAAALGVPTVSTMGPTVPYLWHPAGERNSVIRKDLSCSPCSKAFCSRHKCMSSITVKEMEEAVGALLGRTGKP
ncbi:MAG: glycosyltransferase family 9 protein [Candidatus Omnitrophica bacterium]|jgi:ADP-heptose:LPS heptosyltransferase|nr:glycosyltransferase family 9 protein [Candidatus Omnitrophota bacterium]